MRIDGDYVFCGECSKPIYGKEIASEMILQGRTIYLCKKCTDIANYSNNNTIKEDNKGDVKC